MYKSRKIINTAYALLLAMALIGVFINLYSYLAIDKLALVGEIRAYRQELIAISDSSSMIPLINSENYFPQNTHQVATNRLSDLVDDIEELSNNIHLPTNQINVSLISKLESPYSGTRSHEKTLNNLKTDSIEYGAIIDSVHSIFSIDLRRDLEDRIFYSDSEKLIVQSASQKIDNIVRNLESITKDSKSGFDDNYVNKLKEIKATIENLNSINEAATAQTSIDSIKETTEQKLKNKYEQILDIRMRILEFNKELSEIELKLI